MHGEGTSKKHVCIGNPSPVVVTSKPGRVVMTGTRQVNEGFSVISDDYGETWGPAVYQPSLNAPRQHGSGAPPPAYGQNISNWDFCKIVILSRFVALSFLLTRKASPFQTCPDRPRACSFRAGG